LEARYAPDFAILELQSGVLSIGGKYEMKCTVLLTGDKNRARLIACFKSLFTPPIRRLLSSTGIVVPEVVALKGIQCLK
jgi:hypothetical protein